MTDERKLDLSLSFHLLFQETQYLGPGVTAGMG